MEKGVECWGNHHNWCKRAQRPCSKSRKHGEWETDCLLLLVRHFFLIANIVTTSKAPVTTSVALVTALDMLVKIGGGPGALFTLGSHVEAVGWPVDKEDGHRVVAEVSCFTNAWPCGHQRRQWRRKSTISHLQSTEGPTQAKDGKDFQQNLPSSMWSLQRQVGLWLELHVFENRHQWPHALEKHCEFARCTHICIFLCALVRLPLEPYFSWERRPICNLHWCFSGVSYFGPFQIYPNFMFMKCAQLHLGFIYMF